jgi:lipoprotein-releasing system ATP-binding protein
MIEAVKISKQYENLQVLKNVSLNIKAGEIVAIVGSSGAGKSTLLQILGTLDRPTSGSVIINGVDVFNLNANQISAFRNKHIGFVFQFHHLLPEFTAIENIIIPGLIAKRDKKELMAKANELLSYLGLLSRAHHKPAALSGGEAQRIAVARALINQPSIIMADEPSGNLDSKNAIELHQLFFDLREAFNQTFILVTHNLQLAEKADRIISIQDGYLSN